MTPMATMLPTNRQGATDSHFIVISLDFLILKIGYGSRERGTRRIEIRSLVTTSLHRISIVKALLFNGRPTPESPQQLYGAGVRHSTITDDMPVFINIRYLLTS